MRAAPSALLVSILHWRCLEYIRLYLGPFNPLSFNYPLEMLFLVLSLGLVLGLFQFSIGDADQVHELVYVGVVEYEVSILHWRCVYKAWPG